MNKNMIAIRPMTYATRRLLAGDTFTASRRDAELFRRLGRANEVVTHQKTGDQLVNLRELYQQKFDKKPYHGWDAATIAEKLAEAPLDEAKD